MKKMFPCYPLQAYRRASTLFVLLGAAILSLSQIQAQDVDSDVRITRIDSTVNGELTTTLREPGSQFTADLNELVTVTFNHTQSGLFLLLEDDIEVARVRTDPLISQISYTPTSAGFSQLSVVFSEDGDQAGDNNSDSILLQKIGISLNEPQENDLVPASSRFFINGSAFLLDSFLRNMAFFVRAEPGQLRENMPYLAGDKVVVDDRLYAVLNNGQLSPGSIAAAGGLVSENPDVVTTISGLNFRYIGPELVDQHDYFQGDYVLSNGRLYRVSVGGRPVDGAAQAGLLSSVESEDDIPIVEFVEGEVGFRYTTTPRELQTGMNVAAGDFVRSGTRIYQARSGGSVSSAAPLLRGTNPNVPLSLDGIEFVYRNVKVFRSNAPYFQGELVGSGDHLFEVVFPGTTASGASAQGLAAVSGIQRVDGRVGFTFVANELESGDPQFLPRQYHKYQNVGTDNATPFTTAWSPQDSVVDPRNWFGPDGYFERDTRIEVFAMVTDSKDFSRLSAPVPIDVLPPIDPGAAVETEIVNPSDGRVVAPNTTIQISAEGKDGLEIKNIVESVQFFIDGIPQDIPDSDFPYTQEWIPTTAGTRVLNTVVTDRVGNRTISEDVRVNVTDNRPFVEIRNPLGTSFENPREISSLDSFDFKAFAVGSGGVLNRITSVAFQSDGNLIGNGTFNQGTGLWEFSTVFGGSDNFQPGRVYSISAVATDVNGLTASSLIEYITINAPDISPPVVTITSPSEGERAVAGETLELAIEASDSDGFVATVEVLADGTSVGFASFVSEGAYSFELTPTLENLGNLLITARATDNEGTTDSDSVTVGVTPPTISVEIVEPTQAQSILLGDSLDFRAEVTSTADVQKVEYFIDGAFVGELTEAPYELEVPFTSSSPENEPFEVTAIATDVNDVVSARSEPVEVEVAPLNPLLREEDFIVQTFSDLFNREPNETEKENALLALDGTLEARAEYLAQLLTSATAQNVEIATMIYRSMTGEWPDSDALNQALADLFGRSSSGSTFEGTIVSGINESFTLTLPAGASATASVTGDPSEGFELRNPTLSIFAPNGSLVAFNDDFNGLDPQIAFTASQSGSYTFAVGEFGSNDSGNFILTIDSSAVGGIGNVNPDALTEALVPEFEARFSSFNSSDGVLAQVFENKHLGASPTLLNQRRLNNALSTEFGSNLTQYITQFALDNESTNLVGPSGNNLSSQLRYEFPNRPVDRVPYVHALAALLESRPTDSQVENAISQNLTAFVGSLLAGPGYYERFNTETSRAGKIVQYLASFGVFDDTGVNVAELAPEADFDGDGFDNEAEFNAGTNPVDATDFPDSWYAGAAMLDEGWRSFDWFKAFRPVSGDWIYHARHGWLYVIADDTSSLFLWDSGLGRWMFTNETVYPWMYAFGSDEGWVFFFENGSPGARFFGRGDNGQVVSEEELSESP